MQNLLARLIHAREEDEKEKDKVKDVDDLEDDDLDEDDDEDFVVIPIIVIVVEIFVVFLVEVVVLEVVDVLVFVLLFLVLFTRVDEPREQILHASPPAQDAPREPGRLPHITFAQLCPWRGAPSPSTSKPSARIM